MVILFDDVKKTLGIDTRKPVIWVGGIETHLDAATYLNYNGSISAPLEPYPVPEGVRRCVALDTSRLLIGLSCEENLPMLCISQKFVGVLHNATAREACNFTNGVVVEPLHNCYQMAETCPKDRLTLKPKSLEHERMPSDTTTSLARVGRNHPIDVNIVNIKVDDFLYSNDLLMGMNGSVFCSKRKAPITQMRLELRYNKTAGGLTLWVDKSGRGVWPPKCVGGHVANITGDPRALLITPSAEEGASAVIWCYIKDFIGGSIVFSNSVMRPDLRRDKCPSNISTGGLAFDAIINETASCLRCLKEALSPCVEDDCDLPCDEDGCGHFKISLTDWNETLKRHGEMKGLEECALDEVCAGETFWELTNGGDCNGDGVDDCDDRLVRYYDPLCNGAGEDPRELQAGVWYWDCHTNRIKDFVDVLVEIGTARYFCEDDMPKPRRWSAPEYVESSPYTASSLTTPPSTTLFSTTDTEETTYLSSTLFSTTDTEETTYLPPTTQKPTTQKEAVKQAAKKLHVLTLKSKPNSTITNEDMKSIVKDVSNLLDVNEQALLKAQSAANVSSIAQLLENILVRAPDDFNLTTNKLAVSKQRAIGFQLLSDDPRQEGASFGPKARQIPITDQKQLENYTNAVEAAVILEELPENITMVVVAFAKSDEFIPCRPRLKTDKPNITDLNPPNSSSHNANETVESSSMNVSAKYCPHQVGIIIGCINSHIVQVGLLNGNGSYQLLPDGNHVDLIFRTKTKSTLGQKKTCVYWDFEKRAWLSDGCALVEEREGLDTCRCTHLTHFAQLVSDGGAVAGPHAETLRVLSVCACAVSLSALAGVLSAGAFARKWRRKKENKIMVNLAVALSMYMLLFLWSAVASKPPLNVRQCQKHEDPSVVCQVRGAALHYFVLSSFCWMLVASGTHFLRLTTLTGVGSVSRFVLKASVVGWGVPVLPIAVLFAVEADTYAGKGRDFCYPSGAAFYGAVLAPICAVLLANAVLFALILRRLFACRDRCRSNEGPRPQRPGFNERREFLRKVLVCVAFTFLFGLTWYLGLLSFAEEPAFVFCFVVMCQGPALLGFFVLGEESVRNRLKSMVKRGTTRSEQYSSGTTSTNTKEDRFKNRPERIPLAIRSFSNSTNTSPISEEMSSSQLCPCE